MAAKKKAAAKKAPARKKKAAAKKAPARKKKAAAKKAPAKRKKAAKKAAPARKKKATRKKAAASSASPDASVVCHDGSAAPPEISKPAAPVISHNTAGRGPCQRTANEIVRYGSAVMP